MPSAGSVALSVRLGSCTTITRLVPAISFDVAFLATVVAVEVLVRKVPVSALLLFAFALFTAAVFALACALAFVEATDVRRAVGSCVSGSG